VRSNWRHDPVRARSKQVVAGKSKRIGSMSRLMPQEDGDRRQLKAAGDTSTHSEHQGKTTHMNSNPPSGKSSVPPPVRLVHSRISVLGYSHVPAGGLCEKPHGGATISGK
jgi:hypothetical protein